jgi:APA family basic amino acid/polyamine antiporter
LGVATATALVVSNMIGTAIFTSTGFMAGDLGSVRMIFFIWAVGAVCALAGAYCYSELGINFPSSGGEYVYLTEAYGPTWGFMTGWVSFFAGFSGPIAAAALAFSDYLGYFWPALRQESATTIGQGTLSLKLGGGQVAASALILAFTVLNFFGVRRVGVIQNWLTSLKVIVILGLIIAGFAVGTGDWGHFSMEAARSSPRPIQYQFFVSLFFVYVGYSGWNAATYVAEELKSPSRTLPLALFAGTLMVAVLYIGLNAVFIYAAPLEDMKGVIAVGALAASRLFGPETAGLFSLLMALGLMSTVSAMVAIGPRVYYAMAKNGAFFSAAARVDERWHTPVIAIAAQGVMAMIFTMTPFRDLINFIGFILNFFAAMSVASLFVFRRRDNWQRLRVVSFAWPLVPITFLAVAALMTVIGIILEPRMAAVAIAVVAAGALIYRSLFRKS